MKKEFIIENANDEENPVSLSTEEENLDEMDPDHIEFLRNQFQDDIVEFIFDNITEYIRDNAIPLCEFMTKDDIEVIIDEL